MLPGELSAGEAQDPFLVSAHIISDPGASQPLQQAVDGLLAWVHPGLPLFRVSERRAPRRRRKAPRAAQPALAVVLFLREAGGQEPILRAHRALQRPPWRHHHAERAPGGLRPYLPCSQDFFSLGPGTPLWAVRPVHYGREAVRFTVYCRHDSYADALGLYGLILGRRPSQRKADFCVFPVFSGPAADVQFSLKRLPCGQAPAPADSCVLEFRVGDLGELVPRLPRPCSPISAGRWQTEDHDGNRILLQVPGRGRVSSASPRALALRPGPLRVPQALALGLGPLHVPWRPGRLPSSRPSPLGGLPVPSAPARGASGNPPHPTCRTECAWFPPPCGAPPLSATLLLPAVG